MKIGDMVKVVSEKSSLTESADRRGRIGTVVKIYEHSVEVDFVGDGNYWDTRYVDPKDLKVLSKKV